LVFVAGLQEGEEPALILNDDPVAVFGFFHEMRGDDNGGAAGGMVVAEGTPESISKNRQSYTGKYLKTLL